MKKFAGFFFFFPNPMTKYAFFHDFLMELVVFLWSFEDICFYFMIAWKNLHFSLVIWWNSLFCCLLRKSALFMRFFDVISGVFLKSWFFCKISRGFFLDFFVDFWKKLPFFFCIFMLKFAFSCDLLMAFVLFRDFLKRNFCIFIVNLWRNLRFFTILWQNLHFFLWFLVETYIFLQFFDETSDFFQSPVLKFVFFLSVSQNSCFFNDSLIKFTFFCDS